MKPALLIIDIQNEFFNNNQVCSDSLKSAIEYINAAIDLFRKKNLPIVDAVIVTGFCAEFCVLSTYRGAEDFDFKPIILKDSLASDNTEHIRFVEEISETISFGALKTLL
jgi:nicotinamidase-related amidase